MWKNYLITAWRNMMRNRMFSLVNIAGLALAIAASLLIGLFIYYEKNYDRQSPHATNIWRAYNETVTDGKVVTQDANTHAILGPSLKADLPEVVDFIRLYNRNQPEVTILHNNQPIQIEKAWMTDPAFLRMFPQQFISGDPATCLTKPNSIIVTETTAEKIFRRKDVAGEILHVPGGWLRGDYTITGVVKDPPANTHIKFHILASYATREAANVPGWDSYWDYTYFQLVPGANVNKVRDQLAIYSDKFLKEEGIRLNMQPFTEIHLNSKLTYEIEPNSDAGTIRVLGFIALFIVLIAFINYINLTTSSSIIRAKEVGVRKVLGADRSQLMKQFLTEGGMISAVAILIALGLLWLALPGFEKFIGKQLVNYAGFDKSYWLLVPALWLLAVLCACIYPAVALSSFSPIKTLRNNLVIGGKNNLRRVLVVFQFACSTILIIGILVIVQQLNFLRSHNKGLSLDHVIALKIPEPDWNIDSLNQQRMEVFRNKLKEIPEVKSVATSSIVPGQGITTIAGTSGGMFWTAAPAAATTATVYFYHTDTSFFSTYNIPF
ncbi:MAG TPA: ABC transporter permease, partial [Flavisolibacter sp.]|nr:ABC transporter permease [Flavisolibacter sp.]